MKILFLCKASTKTGLGHLIRSRSLANQFAKQQASVNIDFTIIGESLVARLMNEVGYPYSIYEDESLLPTLGSYDVCFFDMIDISDSLFHKVSDQVQLKVSISPIFNKMSSVDIFFNRTKYHNLPDAHLPPNIYSSLEYTIIQDACKKIKTSIYEDNLELSQFPIAVCMGGGDAANKTLNFLKSLKKCKVPATFWVMLGEGYSHSYDQLISEIKKNSDHEIILAKANKSMWQILKNCILAILPGGITTYEAAYAGLPTLNLLENEDSYFLIKELEEEKVCLYNGKINTENIESVNSVIERLYHNRKELLMMHLNSKQLIPNESARNIYNKCAEILNEKISRAKMS